MLPGLTPFLIATVMKLDVEASPAVVNGTVFAGPVTATASGGSGVYAYSWAKEGGGDIEPASPSSASTTFIRGGHQSGPQTATMVCRAVDLMTGAEGLSNPVTVNIGF